MTEATISDNHLSKPSLELFLTVVTGEKKGLKRLVFEGCAQNCAELKNTIQDYLSKGANARPSLKKSRLSNGSVSEKSSVAA